MRGVRRVNETNLLVGCSVLPRAVLPLVFSVRSRGTRNTVLSPRRGNPAQHRHRPSFARVGGLS